GAHVDVGDRAAVVAGRARQSPTRRQALGHAVAVLGSEVRERLLLAVLETEAGRSEEGRGGERGAGVARIRTRIRDLLDDDRALLPVREGAGDRLARADVDVADGTAVATGRARQIPPRRHGLRHAVAASGSDVRERLLLAVLETEAG